MDYTAHLSSPLGELLLASDGEALTGLWFVGQRYDARGLSDKHVEQPVPVFAETAAWLSDYFAGRVPEGGPLLRPRGSVFQQEVWALLREIPYGQTVTYGDLAKKLAQRRGVARFSARAVGGAVACNPVSLLIPCHRVVGAGGALTGYAGGLARKEALLALEAGEALWRQHDIR